MHGATRQDYIIMMEENTEQKHREHYIAALAFIQKTRRFMQARFRKTTEWNELNAPRRKSSASSTTRFLVKSYKRRAVR
jgi:hypothetical protein